MQIMRFACRPLLPAVFLLIGLAAAAAQGSPEQRRACAPDAMRLCSEFIPNVPKITKCMIAKRRQLSKSCREAMRHHHHREAREVYRHRRYKGYARCRFNLFCN